MSQEKIFELEECMRRICPGALATTLHATQTLMDEINGR